MLIEYGNTVVTPSWELTEDMPTGYSRIYYVLEGEPTYESADTRQVLKPGFLYVLPSTVPYHVWRNPEVDFACTYLHVDFSKYRVNSLIEIPVKPGSCLNDFISTVSAAIREERIDVLFRAAGEAAEEAILNSMLAADPMTAPDGRRIRSLREFMPLE